ncbi:hypothetical protein [Paraburkholderia humisilvae]|uniref:Uncharacterized protein n=1 Tax=Paraburkholderia humisilvae TaxID=627669 RepID=A0A6J5E6S0_9BURK|nr:hypothetical protein [Paraburkholderia humisilvae]CAB3762170.1 hypothetical protein LMG29542_04262 [Paraburkholderia humisilvae]
MKSLLRSLVVVGALTVPVFAFAQANGATASQADAVSATQMSHSGYGGVADGSTAAGNSAPRHHWLGFLRHGNGGNQPGDCVGPVSFCQIYFGS